MSVHRQDAEVHLLLRSVVEAIRQTETAEDDSRVSSDVLFECEVDGVRCVFLRVDVRNHVPRMSGREFDVFRMVARGLPTKDIAASLAISVGTVDTYMRRLFHKFGVSSRAALIARGMQNYAAVRWPRDSWP